MLNRVTLMGRLAIDPELRKTPSGVSVVTFRIAVSRTYNRELTDWLDIVVWRQQAEFVSNYFTKGSMIIVEGSLQSRSYEDKQGNKRTAIEVVADQVHFAGTKQDGQTERPGGSSFPQQKQEVQQGFAGDGQAYPSGFNVGEYVEIEDDGELPF